MMYMIFSLAIILMIIGAIIFIVHKSTELILTPEDFAAALSAFNDDVQIKIYVRSKYSWKEILSRVKSAK